MDERTRAILTTALTQGPSALDKAALAHLGTLASADEAFRPNPYFARSVAAENRAILN